VASVDRLLHYNKSLLEMQDFKKHFYAENPSSNP